MEGAKLNGGRAAADASDEQLMRALAASSDEALQLLYARHAPLVFGLAAQTLDRPAAEEIVQDVFLALWRNAARFDPSRGPLRPWLLQISHHRILNELRRRSRRPLLDADPDGERAAELPDPDPGPSAAAWREYQRAALRAALERLPPAQRQALGLAFFDDLTHQQVADVLQLRLGTAKTRIRAGLMRLREQLAPLLAVLALVLLAGVFALAHRQQADESALALDERALDLVTSSDVKPIRLEAAPNAPAEAHASYRSRPGSDLAVLSLSHFPPAPSGRSYQAWLRSEGRWISLGRAWPDAEGKARLVAHGAALAAAPEALQVTLEPAAGSAAPAGPVVVAWPKP